MGGLADEFLLWPAEHFTEMFIAMKKFLIARKYDTQ